MLTHTITTGLLICLVLGKVIHVTEYIPTKLQIQVLPFARVKLEARSNRIADLLHNMCKGGVLHSEQQRPSRGGHWK
jgi:hypothetical protein